MPETCRGDLGRFAESARFVRHYPEQNPVLRDLLPTITTPTQILAGRDDDLVPWSNNQYLADLLQTARSIPSTPVTSRGSRHRGSMATWSPTGSAVGIGALERPRCQNSPQWDAAAWRSLSWYLVA
jgi:hypothetical protein